MKIRQATSANKNAWDSYVLSHLDATHCHLSGWKNVFKRAYNHRGYYLLAEEKGSITGILPLCQVKSLFFGNQLVSLPFLNYGGVLADSDEARGALIDQALRLGKKLGTSRIELRHINPLDLQGSAPAEKFSENPHKVRMVLSLPESKAVLLESYKAKMKSQIFRSQREGMMVKMGGLELLNDFYKVFSINMRDLGSPVHSKKFFAEIVTEFKPFALIGVVRFQDQPVAAGLIVCFKEVVEIPWASSLREFNKFSPNMMLYWSFLEYACEKGFKTFDFGRSTFGEGTYKFKLQWGAKPSILPWQVLSSNGELITDFSSDKSRFGKVIQLWKKLPLPIAGMIGPIIRKNISL
jgi:FemAB-related protein (PEP-CTERM system-associated)